jgi:hypothetical protein
MKTYEREVTEKKTFIEIDGEEFDFLSVHKIMEELEDTDYGFAALVIYDKKLTDILVKNKVVWQNVRGSYNKSKGYDKFKEKINEFYLAWLDTLD